MIHASKCLVAAAVLAAALLVRPTSAAAQFMSPVTDNAVTVDSAGPAAPELLNPGRLAGLVRRYYPSLLRDAGVMGDVMVRVRVDEAGRAARVTVVSQSHEKFGDAARSIAHQLRFRPAAEGGAAVDVILRITFHPDR
ncbi:MAG TPA: energy transducer TonB [Longimicrobium sp.]